MSYATPQDLIDAFGEDEIVRATTLDGADMAGVNQVRAQARLDEASDLMDSYLRRRYLTPVPPSLVLRRCCCDLARRYLRETGHGEVSDQVLAAFKRQIDWLQEIVAGRVTLDGASLVLSGPLPGARVADRVRAFQTSAPPGGGLDCGRDGGRDNGW